MNEHTGIFIIFGITGDLAKRKLLPALYYLFQNNQLAEDFTILGTTRRDTSVNDIIGDIRKTVSSNGDEVDEDALATLGNRLKMVHMDIGSRDDYHILHKSITDTEASLRTPVNRLFYMAVPPEMFRSIIDGLEKYELHQPGDVTDCRLLIEKPFGTDVQTATDLINHMEQTFSQNQIYRVDHYLAKETAQNILTFRFDNPLFQTVWDHSIIHHIQITAAETIGIEGRINFYNNTGALRDLIQSHLLQLLALTTMEEPDNRTAEAIHKTKQNLLNDILPIRPDQIDQFTARGQYDGYRQEVSDPESLTETFAAIRLEIDNDRWRGVPILLRAGKALKSKVTEISLVFSSPAKPHCKNILTICIQPNEGVELTLRAKKPSFDNVVEDVKMDFNYDISFEHRQPDAYERVLIDAIRGDKTLFTTDEEIITSWKIIQNVLEAWSRNAHGLETYPSGSWGPQSSDVLAQSVDAQWLN